MFMELCRMYTEFIPKVLAWRPWPDGHGPLPLVVLPIRFGRRLLLNVNNM